MPQLIFVAKILFSNQAAKKFEATEKLMSEISEVKESAEQEESDDEEVIFRNLHCKSGHKPGVGDNQV